MAYNENDLKLDSPRRKFNSGFHDGQTAAERGWKPDWKPGTHPSWHYEIGYAMGKVEYELKGKPNQCSDAAWLATFGAEQAA